MHSKIILYSKLLRRDILSNSTDCAEQRKHAAAAAAAAAVSRIDRGGGEAGCYSGGEQERS